MTWREDIAEWQKNGEELEALAARMPDVPFSVCVRERLLEWITCRQSLQAFLGYVRQVSAVFGAPERTDSYTPTSSDEAFPVLYAAWKVSAKESGTEPLSVVVQFLDSDCKLDPREEYVPDTTGKAPPIHSECRHALDELQTELEDAEPVAAS